MPIKPLLIRQRHAELGRIRLGYKAATSNGGTRPAKLETFRFTSPSERYISDLATLYGGEARAWDNDGKPEFEVYTEAKSIPFIVIKEGLSQWMERWAGGGVQRRCDGEFLDPRTVDNERRPCICAQENEITCKPTTRLSGMLPELDALGSWRLESKGWNAAAEIPAVAELAEYVGDLVPAHLNLVERRSVRDGKTSRFVVPVLDLQIGAARLREVVASMSGTTPAIEAVARPALEAGASAGTDAGSTADDAYTKPLLLVAEAPDHARLAWIWDRAREVGIVGTGSQESPRKEEFVAAWKAKAHEIKNSAPATGEPDADGAFDIEVVAAAADPDAVWQQIVVAGGQRDMDLDAIHEDFKARMGGLLADDASASELQAYLTQLTQGDAA